MSFQISRRMLLKFFGASAGVAALEPIAGPLLNGSLAYADELPFRFIPPRLPHPLPIYQRLKNFLAAAGGAGSVSPAAEDTRLAEYTVLDDVIVPPEYRSVVVISRKNRKSHFEVESGHEKNRRIHGLSGLAINSERSDIYKGVTLWGSAPHQQGDDRYLVATRPATKEVFNLSSDNLGNRIIGTAYNCWGQPLRGTL